LFSFLTPRKHVYNHSAFSSSDQLLFSFSQHQQNTLTTIQNNLPRPAVFFFTKPTLQTFNHSAYSSRDQLFFSIWQHQQNTFTTIQHILAKTNCCFLFHNTNKTRLQQFSIFQSRPTVVLYFTTPTKHLYNHSAYSSREKLLFSFSQHQRKMFTTIQHILAETNCCSLFHNTNNTRLQPFSIF
jgi:hypothetical protein